MRRRGVGRSVLRTAATTAVVVGTARAVGGAMDSHAANKQAEQQAQIDAQQAAYDSQAQLQQQQYEMQQMQQQMAAMQAQQAQVAAPPPPPPAPAPVAAAAPASPDLMAQLQQLAQMRDAGILSDEEFAAAKTKLLGG